MNAETFQRELRNRFSPAGKWAYAGFVLIAGFLLFSEHRAHFFGVLPYLLLLACPLLHIFMHRGHGEHGGHSAYGEGHKPREGGGA